MGTVLGIDFGMKKIGLAVGDDRTKLAEPLKVVKYCAEEELLKTIAGVVQLHNINKIVVGISEKLSAKEARKFGKKLKTEIKLDIVFQDETLTTKDAQQKSIEAGIGRKRRRQMEDAYAAALILQSYFDSL